MKPFYSLPILCSLLLTLAEPASGQTNITTWEVDLQHSGNNTTETILTPGNISVPGNFGLLFSQTLDGVSSGTVNGQTYGQPMLMSGVNVSGTTHNIVFVATEHDSIWAFDADSNIGPNASPLWMDSLLPAGTIPVPQGLVGSGDIPIELGITTTPVIDPTSNTIYIVSKFQRLSDSTYHQYLYALDVATGTTKFGSPVEINPTFAGSSSDSSGGVIPFSALHQHTRSAMTLNNGILYISYASHSDTTPYHGEIIGYNATTLAQVPSQSFITTPNGMEGGIWQGGAGPAFDTAGNIFVSIANGSWDQANPQNGTDWGESMLKIPTTTGTGLAVSYSNTLNWFTPNIWNTLNGGDLDVGSGGLCILPDQTGPHTHIMVGGGKGAVLYVVDRDNLSGINTPDNAIQEIPETGGDWLFVTPAYYNGYIYYSPSGGPLEQRAVGYNATNGSYISATPVTSNNNYNGKGSGCFISSSGTTNGIIWILNGSGIDAYNATNVSGAPIYTAGSELPGNIGTQNTKFSLPMVANGKLYFTAFDSNYIGHLLVFGLISSGSGTPAAPTNALATANSSSAITITWTDNSNNETGFSVQRSTSPTGSFTQVGSTGANVTTYTDSGLSAGTTYYYLVEAYNANGASAKTNVTSAATFPNYTPSGIVAYWPMDETSGTIVHDVTGNGNTGDINGEALLQAGLINNGVNFHGTGQAASSVIVPNTSTMQFTASQSFTLSAWVNPSALRSSEETIISKSRDQGNYYGIWINANNQWVFRGPGGDIVGPTATQDAWTHVAAVQNGAAGTRTLYVDGTVAATGVAQAGDGAGNLWMAQQNITGTFESFPGTLDEVRLYNTALSGSQITDLMATPVLQASSVQTQGNAGTFPLVIFPSVYQVTEPREGSTVGSYSLVLNFSAPVSGLSASLGLQGGGVAVGSVSSVTYDPTGEIVTVNLTGVGNVQALDLHLTGVPSGALSAGGTQDIPFNVLWGDANGDGVVSTLDASIVQNSETPLVNSTNFLYDINCDGAITAADVSLVNSYIGNSLGTETPTNLALFQPVTVSSVDSGHPGNVGSNAVDGNLTTRWESAYSDPQWIYVNLGSVCTINAVNIAWENSGGSNYLIQVSNDATNWTTVATVTGNTIGSGNGSAWQDNTGLNATGQYVRMYGETRDDGSAYGYSMWEFQVIGTVGSATPSPPVITGALTASGTVDSPFNYQIAANNNPTSYTTSTLPGGLSLSTGGDITGMPTASGTTGVTISAINSSGTGTATLSIQIANMPAGPVPSITSGSTAAGNVGTPFSYQITASNSPTSYSTSTLPSWLTFNATNETISGTPTAIGTTNITLYATNGNGTGSGPLSIVINAATGQTVVTWTGGGDGTTYLSGANWSTGTTPVVNGTAAGIAVINTPGANITYNPGGDYILDNGGELEITAGSWTQINGNAWIQLGEATNGASAGNGNILVNGGTFNQGSSGNTPFNVEGTGNTFKISSGAANFNNGVNVVSGLTWTQTGGTVTGTNGGFSVQAGGAFTQSGGSGSYAGTGNISGGSWTQSGGIMTLNGDLQTDTGGTFLLSSGTLNVLVEADFNSKTASMTGGLLNIKNLFTMVNGPTGSTFNFSGGIIDDQANANGGWYGPGTSDPFNFTTASTGTLEFNAGDVTLATVQGWVSAGDIAYNDTTDPSVFTTTQIGGNTDVFVTPPPVPISKTCIILTLLGLCGTAMFILVRHRTRRKPEGLDSAGK